MDKSMKMHIIIPFRPSLGGMNSEDEAMFQRDDFKWVNSNGEVNSRSNDNDIDRALYSIEKNSAYKHKIIVVIDSDMTPHKDWLKQYDNVEIFKCTYICPPESKEFRSFFNLTGGLREAVLACPDDAFICYAFLSDLIATKNWDKHLNIAYKAYGDSYVYTPMWVEPRGKLYIDDESITFNNIWVKNRENCCHCLIFPKLSLEKSITELEFGKPITELELDNWIKAATEKHPKPDYDDWEFNGVILEPCGSRIYGYFIAICVLAKKLKKVVQNIKLGPGCDLMIDNNLGNKVVCVRSFVFHSHGDFIFDDIKVKRIEPVL